MQYVITCMPTLVKKTKLVISNESVLIPSFDLVGYRHIVARFLWNLLVFVFFLFVVYGFEYPLIRSSIIFIGIKKKETN